MKPTLILMSALLFTACSQAALQPSTDAAAPPTDTAQVTDASSTAQPAASLPEQASGPTVDALSNPAASALLKIRRPPATVKNWDWQLGATDSQINEAGMQLMDVDGFEASAATVARMKAQGVYTVCYLDVGSWESGRPDSAGYPASLKLQKDPQWPEWFLDIRDVFKPNSVLATLLNARFAMCAAKGFDAVEPDNLQNAENARSGGLTDQDDYNFDGWVADAVHAHGMAVLQKNDPDRALMKDSQGRVLADVFDGILNEQCQQYGECGYLAAYSSRNKLVLDTEYRRRALDCGLAAQYGISMIGRDLGLKAPGAKGYRRSSCN